jgi:hypothetical protein
MITDVYHFPARSYSHPVPAVLWTVADLQDERPDLTTRQAWEVLKLGIAEQHTVIGVTWAVLMHAAEMLYGRRDARRAL